ncbi:hypothetical protein I79_003620 [Cricetulus griseus]|uniref:Uncharacterized protein n=1 Tax=Cricetulus griseus TaxID=10029 RepID=G3H0G4_CRIGR|nr:hypothetical protein I79_003620 [Cricetulus griseus]
MTFPFGKGKKNQPLLFAAATANLLAGHQILHSAQQGECCGSQPLFLQLLLGEGACPLQGFMRNACPGKNNKSANCSLLALCGFGHAHIFMYT